MGAVLNIVGGPISLSYYILSPVEERIECLKCLNALFLSSFEWVIVRNIAVVAARLRRRPLVGDPVNSAAQPLFELSCGSRRPHQRNG